jgi:poly(3-hydroxybutyrate) depolymerase
MQNPHRSLLLILCVLCASAVIPPPAQAKPLDLPDDLLPRATLEKIYAAELPDYNPADYQKFYEAHVYLEKYFLTDSAEDRKAITQILEKSQLPIATIGRMCRIHLPWLALPPGPAYVNERIGPHDIQYFLGVPANYDRAKQWPLVVRLPAANAIITDPKQPPKPDDVVQLYTQWVTDEMKSHPDAVLVMPLLNLDELYGPSYKGMNTVIQAIHHVTTRVNIDPKQVYLLGHGMAAHATWNLALHYPTLFAAINPLAGAASADWQRLRLMNLKNTLPIIWHDSTDIIIKPAESTALVNILKTLKYDYDYEQTKNVGHTPTPDIAEKCYKLMRARSRELYPQQVNLRSNRPDPSFNRVDWLQVYQPFNSGAEHELLLRHGTGKIVVNDNAHSVQAAFTKPNRIEAKADNVQTLCFYLNEQMVDLSKPITVVVNTKTRFEGIVKPSLDAMLKDQLFLGRGWRYFTASVDIDLAPLTPASTKPSTRPAFIPANATQLYFTTDDGKTFFTAEASNKPPFTHDGKLAYRAHLYSTDGGKTAWVAYLSKFSPASPDPMVKRIGETAWTPMASPGATAILDVKAPTGTAAATSGKPAVEVYPK